MKYTVEINSLRDFDFWSGAKTWFNTFLNIGAVDWLDDYVDEMSACSDLTDTDINDFIWFDACNVLAENLGIDPDDLLTLESRGLTIDDVDVIKSDDNE